MDPKPLPEPKVQVEDDRTGTSVETLKRAILDNLYYVVGKTPEAATAIDHYSAVAYTVRDRILARWIATLESLASRDVRIVSYLSAEYLVGPHLANSLLNLGVEAPFRQAIKELNQDLNRIIDQEQEPGLGNGGLGRLAACYMESMSTLGVQAIGYGIRYQYGIFHQIIQDGWQVELTDYWLRYGNPWEIRRPQASVDVGYFGHTEASTDSKGAYKVRWIPRSVVRGVPYDTPVLGYRSGVVNDMRLWRSEATESFYFGRFNSGDYQGAVADKVFAENITKVLYPNDEEIQGKELRLQQQYFFTSCSLQDMIRFHTSLRPAAGELPREVGYPAQRHASFHRRGRTDAPADGRARHGVGPGLEHHHPHVQFHQSHVVARSPGTLAAAYVRLLAAAAPRNHLRNQPSIFG